MKIKDTGSLTLPRYYIILDASVDGQGVGRMVFRAGINEKKLRTLARLRERYRIAMFKRCRCKSGRSAYNYHNINLLEEKIRKVENLDGDRWGLWYLIGHYDEFTQNQRRKWGKIITMDDIPLWKRGIKPRTEFRLCLNEILENLEDITKKYLNMG